MAAGFASVAGGPPSGEAATLGDDARRLRATALALAERELGSYAPVLAAMRADPAPERGGRIRAALSEAADAPLSIARCSAQVAELGVSSLAQGSEHLRGDAVTGVVLAEAACASAAQLVALNLADAPGDARRAEADRLAATAAAARRRALG
jgi:formiminotetrahydrofolate cyclodeaminase